MGTLLNEDGEYRIAVSNILLGTEKNTGVFFLGIQSYIGIQVRMFNQKGNA